MVGRPPMRLRNIIAAATLCVALLVPTSAFAQSSSTGYSEPAGSVQQQLGTQNSSNDAKPTAAKTESGKLPFTGLDIALVVAAGGVLLAMGFGIRRISRPSELA